MRAIACAIVLAAMITAEQMSCIADKRTPDRTTRCVLTFMIMVTGILMVFGL